MTTVLLASRSADKLREIRQILAPVPGLRIVTLDEVEFPPGPAEDGIETFDTFLGNARAKAEWFGTRADLPTLADDSGLCVDALGGAPGVHSRRFARAEAAQDQDAANNALLLRRLEGVPDDRRGAAYLCAAVLRHPDGRTEAALGSVRGFIAHEPAGDGGFGYDPLFILPAAGATFGQLPAATKHAHSHRARAFRALATALAHIER